jgi:TRAP-type mannitol/chloroaromatic compound transport system permease large subunit
VPPFVAMQLLVLLLTMLFPQLALWLPRKML